MTFSRGFEDVTEDTRESRQPVQPTEEMKADLEARAARAKQLQDESDAPIAADPDFTLDNDGTYSSDMFK
ncbi:hypothetical protein [Rhizobium binxianense]